MKRMIVLALILLASMFVTMFATSAIAAATISMSRINTASDQIQHIKMVNPLGDPIDGGGPPGTT
jgi:hypothetical protein